MKIFTATTLSKNDRLKIENFLYNCDFNSEISFIENDMNYYEDFPCFYTVYESDNIIAFMSAFIPDTKTCEIYFHINPILVEKADKIISILLDKLQINLNAYNINEIYLLFDNRTSIPEYIKTISNFSHSECLMQYIASNYMPYTFTNEISFTQKTSIDNISIDSLINNTIIGTCEIEYSDNYALIHDVFIKESYRGHGYGTQTLHNALNTIMNMNITNILLHVNSANTSAFAMYSHHGFVIKQQIYYFKIN